jgi:hypothetical protein
MYIKWLAALITVVSGTAIAVPALAQKNSQQGQGHAVVTILPAKSGEQVPNVSPQDVKVKVNGKESAVTGFASLRGPDSRLELVVLIDGSARASLGQQFNEITTFVKEMPANAKVGFAYMENGRAAMAGPLTSDAAQAAKGLHMSAGSVGSNASPYFCLSDLAKHWPSDDRTARREVVMITDGVDNYERRFDPDDPYVQTAINDSVRTGLVVYSMYWQDRGLANSTGYETSAGQNLLFMVSQATGGKSYWEGTGNPVSFEPYFADLRRRLNHQYELSFDSPSNGKPEVKDLKVELHVPSAKVEAPQKVLVAAGSRSLGE